MSSKAKEFTTHQMDIIDGHTAQVALFQTPPTNTAVQKIEWFEYQPLCLNEQACSALEFRVPGTGAHYFDLPKTRLQLKIKLVQKDGTDLTDRAKVGPVNLLHSSLFSSVDVNFQQQSINKSAPPQYAYKSYWDTLLRYGSDVKASYLQAQLFHPDLAGSFDNADPYPSDDDDATGSVPNDGLITRANYCKTSKVVELEGPLHIDVFQQPRYLLNGVPIHLKLWQNSDAFKLMSSERGAGYRIVITSAVLKMCGVTITPEVLLAHNEALKKSPALYPFYQSDFKVFSLAKGLYDFTADNLYQGAVPSKVLVALVAAEAYNGTYSRNPFNCQHASLKHLAFTVDGVSVPARPLQLDYSADQYLDGYLTLFTGCGFYGANESSGISRYNYKKGYCLYLIDLDSQHSTDYLPLPKQGNTRIAVHFAHALPEAMNLVVYGKFPAVLKIDAARNVVL